MSGRRDKKPPLVPQIRATAQQPAMSQIHQSEYFSGPVPPPSLLARYNDVVPNGAERILAMAERQSAHRESLESRLLDGNLSVQKQGSYLAFVLSLIIVAGGIYLMATGKDGYGFATIIANVAALAGVFVYSRRQQAKERAEKTEALASRKAK